MWGETKEGRKGGYFRVEVATGAMVTPCRGSPLSIKSTLGRKLWGPEIGRMGKLGSMRDADRDALLY